MLNILIADMLDDVIERVTKIRDEIKSNTSYHVEDDVRKDHAEALFVIAELIHPDEVVDRSRLSVINNEKEVLDFKKDLEKFKEGLILLDKRMAVWLNKKLKP